MSQTIRIRPKTRETLEHMARKEATTMTQMLDRVVDAYRRQQFLRATNEAFAALRRKPKAWAQEEKERRQWDATLADDLRDRES